MITYTNISEDPDAWDPLADTTPLEPITPELLTALDMEQAAAVDFRLEAPVLFDLIAARVAQFVPGQEDQIALTAAIGLDFLGYLRDTHAELRKAWETIDELHRQRETLAQRLDDLADGAAYVKGRR